MCEKKTDLKNTDTEPLLPWEEAGLQWRDSKADDWTKTGGWAGWGGGGRGCRGQRLRFEVIPHEHVSPSCLKQPQRSHSWPSLSVETLLLRTRVVRPDTRGIFSPSPTPTREGGESHGDVSAPARSAPLKEHFLRPLVMSPRPLKPLSCDAALSMKKTLAELQHEAEHHGGGCKQRAKYDVLLEQPAAAPPGGGTWSLNACVKPGGDDLKPKDLLPSAVGGDRKQDKPLNRKLKTAFFFFLLYVVELQCVRLVLLRALIPHARYLMSS